MSRLLIRNARLVNEGQEFDADVLVANGRIEKIASCIQGQTAEIEIDAQGQWLLPGMIDDETLDRFAVIGTHAEIGERLLERYSGVVTDVEFSIAISPEHHERDRETLRNLASVVQGADDAVARARISQAFGRLIRRADDRGVFVMLDAAAPTRLFSSLPEGVQIERVSLVEAIEATAGFLAKGQASDTD